MNSRFKIQKIKKQFAVIAALGILLFALPGGRVSGEEPASPSRKDESRAEFEAMKAEWEKVRDQQIEMIREKEAELDEMKETIFRQLRATQGGVLAGADPAKPDAGVLEEAAQTSQTAILGRRIVDLKEANRRLTNEISTLQIKNKMLEERLRTSGRGESPLLQKEIAEFEAQKAAFLKERQKFFDEMARQKARLQAKQLSPEND